MGERLPDFLVVQELLLQANAFFLMPRTTYEQALSMEAPRPSTWAPPTKFGEQPLPPLADTPLQEKELLHNFLTLRTGFALIYSLFYLSLLWWETEKATSMALFVCVPQGKLTETFIMLLCIEHYIYRCYPEWWCIIIIVAPYIIVN